MDKNDNKPINMADIEQHPAHIAKIEQLRSKEHIKASKNGYLDQEEILLTLSILIFVALTHLANFLFPVTAGVSVPTTIIDDTLVIGKVRIAYQMVLAALAGILVTALYVLWFLKTRTGLIIRAISQNLPAALLMGAGVNRMYYVAMILSVIPPTICMSFGFHY